MAYEIIRFTIADPLLSTLKGMATGDESIHLTAKRLLSEILEGKEPTIEPTALAEIESRLEKLETQEVTPIAPDALEEIRDRLNQLETGQPELHETMTNLVERLEKLEGWLSSLRDDRALAKCSLGKFSDRLESLEESLKGWISGFKKEGDWQSQQIAHAAVRLDALEKGKVETAPREIPKGLTHKEMSLVCGIAPSNLGKVAKNRESWPEGYMWSDESKKWFPMEV